MSVTARPELFLGPFRARRLSQRLLLEEVGDIEVVAVVEGDSARRHGRVLRLGPGSSLQWCRGAGLRLTRACRRLDLRCRLATAGLVSVRRGRRSRALGGP